MKQIFENIFKNNLWRGRTSFSGRGADPDQTENIRKEIPILLKEMKIKSILDIPCGDFNWMKEIDLDGIKYIGADIVEDIVKNNNKYKTKGKTFKVLDITQDKLPKVDLIIVRDCLVHMSYPDIAKAIKQIKASKSKYLLTTTFPGRMENNDIATGRWFPINLEIDPFSFPQPIKVVNEGCTQSKGKYSDKSLGLWKISKI